MHDKFYTYIATRGKDLGSYIVYVVKKKKNRRHDPMINDTDRADRDMSICWLPVTNPTKTAFGERSTCSNAKLVSRNKSDETTMW